MHPELLIPLIRVFNGPTVAPRIGVSRRTHPIIRVFHARYHFITSTLRYNHPNPFWQFRDFDRRQNASLAPSFSLATATPECRRRYATGDTAPMLRREFI